MNQIQFMKRHLKAHKGTSPFCPQTSLLANRFRSHNLLSFYIFSRIDTAGAFAVAELSRKFTTRQHLSSDSQSLSLCVALPIRLIDWFCLRAYVRSPERGCRYSTQLRAPDGQASAHRSSEHAHSTRAGRKPHSHCYSLHCTVLQRTPAYSSWVTR